MKTLLSVVALFCLVHATHAQQASLKRAEERLLRGNYAEAQALFEKLAEDRSKRPAATVGISRAHENQGNYDKAMSVVEAALKDLPKNATLLGRKAQLLYLRGRWKDAASTAHRAIEQDSDTYVGRWVLGQIYRDQGELQKANSEFAWFIRAYNNNDIPDPHNMLLVGLAALERARYYNLPDQYRFVLKEILLTLVKEHKSFWPGEYHAGLLFAEKYNKAAAYRSFEKALAINPRAVPVLVAKGKTSLERFQAKDANYYADRALKLNPNLPSALRLKADVDLASGEIDKATKILEKAMGINPRDERTLARLATCQRMQGNEKAYKEIIARVEKQNPKSGRFFYELGDNLESGKHYDEAEKYYRLSMERNPKLHSARNALGLLHMRLGDERKARTVLEGAFKVDKFNVRVFNSLEVLDHLDKYATLKTDHFVIRYDPKNDKVLAAFMAKYAEEIYDDLAKQFQYKPRQPILLQVFNNHEMFSGRVLALPDLHTIGACTGRLVAMVSPRDKSKVIGKRFNWVRVLRHELVHVFNVTQTKHRVPHWFTEGLAVGYENYPTTGTWRELLVRQVRSGDLMNLDNILLGFVRPSSPEQWHQAYLQSELYVQYLKKKYGPKVIGAFLKVYAGGQNSDVALRRVCNIDKKTFEKGYLAFLRQKAAEYGENVRPVLSFKELKKAHAAKPKDPDLLAQLAERYLALGDRDKARDLANQAASIDDTNSLAVYVKAKMLIRDGDARSAGRQLQVVYKAKKPHARAIRLLGKLQLEQKLFEQAAKTYELGRKQQPYEESWLVQLVKIYNETGDKSKLVDVLEDLAPLAPDELGVRRKLAAHYLNERNHAKAERYAREALEIDVLDSKAQDVLKRALQGQKKEDALRELERLLD